MKESSSERLIVHAYTVSEALAHYAVTARSGLSDAGIIEYERRYGKNVLPENPQFTVLLLVVRQFQNPLSIILGVAAITTAILGKYIDCFFIALAIVVNAGLGFFQEYKAERAVQHLRSFISSRTRVVRNGREIEIDARDVVVGDIVHLRIGARVPADGRLISVESLRIDESVLTGESLPVAKHTQPLPPETTVADRANCVFSGTLVSEGGGLMVVTAVGRETEFGKIATLVEHTKREVTPLARTMSRFSWLIAVVITIVVAGVFSLGVSQGQPIGEMFVVAIAVAVGAIPEALPIALTAVLAIGVERLARQKGILRSLTAAETLGSTSILITDKTGTLTESVLELVSIHTTHELKNHDTHRHHDVQREVTPEQRELLALAAMATDVIVENTEDNPREWRIVGNPLEAAIVQKAAQLGVPYQHRLDRGVTAIIPFGSTHKFSVHAAYVELETELTKRTQPGYAHIIVGAPDVLLDRSDMSKDEYVGLREQLRRLSEDGMRVVGVAIAYLARASDTHTQYRPQDIQNVTFLGIVSFYDPIRPEVPEAVRAIEAAGLRVVIATGDLPGTASAIARDIGFVVSPHDVLTGAALATMSDAELRAQLEHVRVFARVTPADKLRIARCYQYRGDIVAMTGDGVNDAPALKAVDIGIAVGAGSDVAKGVADLILLDNNFTTIVAAIEEGRRVVHNVRKTFVYLVSNSLDEIMLIGGSLLLLQPMPLTAMQIIWVNFFTGSLPAIAFAFDTNTPRTARAHHTKHILDSHTRLLTMLLALGTSSALLALYIVLLHFKVPTELAHTFLFACFASYILFVAYCMRDTKVPIWRTSSVFSNRVLNYGVGMGIILLVCTLYVPWFQDIFSTSTLPPLWLFGALLYVIVMMVLVEGVKYLVQLLTR
jgi:Ca2+-transporting ATPase